MNNLFTAERIGSWSGVTYLDSGVMQYDPAEKFGPRLLKNFELVLIIDGYSVYETQYEKCHLESGSIIFACPGLREIHHGDTCSPSRHVYLRFNLEEIPAYWPELSDWPACKLRPPRILSETLRQLIEQLAHQSPCSVLPLWESFFEHYFEPSFLRRYGANGSTRISTDNFAAWGRDKTTRRRK